MVQVAEDLHAVASTVVDGPHTSHIHAARQWRGAQRAAAVVVVLLVAARIIGLLLSAGVRSRR